MRLGIIIIALWFLGCSGENSPDCLKSTGQKISQQITLESFQGLLVNNEFRVVLTQAPTQMVTLTIGENLFSEIDFQINNGVLEIKNQVSCKWVRDYDYPVLEISHPNLQSIEIIGGSIVESTGVITQPLLSLKSIDSNGIFQLEVDVDELRVNNNEITNYFISGSADQLSLVYSSGDSRFEGANLLIRDAVVNHASSNDVIVNVSNSLTGIVRSTGDLIYVGRTPNVLDVELNNRGRLIDGTE